VLPGIGAPYASQAVDAEVPARRTPEELVADVTA
jgi:hypothetical protein